MELSWTWRDARRVAWTFAQAALAVILADAAGWLRGGPLDWRAWAVAGVAAGVSAVKNLILPEDSPVK